jgi:hypothetical protein
LNQAIHKRLTLLVGLLFDSENGGIMLLRNVGELPSDYMVSHPRRLYLQTICTFPPVNCKFSAVLG